MTRIDDAIARAEKATPGPWEQYPNTGEAGQDVWTKGSLGSSAPIFIGTMARCWEDATFIAHARQDVEDFAKTLAEIKKTHQTIRDDGLMVERCMADGEEQPCETVRIIERLEGK